MGFYIMKILISVFKNYFLFFVYVCIIQDNFELRMLKKRNIYERFDTINCVYE